MPSVGDSVNLGAFTATRLDSTDPYPLNPNGVVTSSIHNDTALAMTGSWLFDLNGATSTSLEFNVSNNQANNVVIFYDAAGVEVHRGIITGGVDLHAVSFTLPAGESFSSFEIQTVNVGGTAMVDYIEMHDVVLDFSSSPSVIVPPPLIQNVHDGEAYHGGDENNTFIVADVGYFDGADSGVNGGSGIDTLQLTGANQTFDLGSIVGELASVEIIDITGTGNNTLNLSLGDVLEQGETSLFTADETTQMMIKGDAGDVVDLDDLLPDGTDPGDWASAGIATVAGVTYNVYQHSTLDAQLLVQDGVTTNLV
jgi:hypothetical protein